MFQKGNPGGRKGISGRKPLAVELGLPRLLEQCWTPEERREVIRTLHALAIDKDNRNCVQAAKLLLAYAYGKPTEHVEVTATDSHDDRLGPARRSYILTALPAIQLNHPDWTSDELKQAAEHQFEAWIEGLNLNAVMTETVQ
jgi:hypothetical protein